MATTVPSSEHFFHRPALARAYADEVLDTTLGVSGGLFLAAPRRVGKSTFVRQDLMPELQSRGLETIYVDLWADKNKDPAEHIANAVREALSREDGVVAKFARSVGVNKLSISALGNGMNFDLSQLGLMKDGTLADALKALSKATEKKIVIVIDEAQHALTTDAGLAALFAMKAARDSLNTDAALHGLQFIATGSNRDKLDTLVNGREQAFYGADMVAFPVLGQEYIEWLVTRSKVPLDAKKSLAVFNTLGGRPEPFVRAVASTRREVTADPKLDANLVLAQHAADGMAQAKRDFMNTIANLPPLQIALLRELASETRLPPGKPRTGLFTAAMRARLQDRLAEDNPASAPAAVESPAIQSALDSLRDKNYLWRSQRGAYWVEDEQFVEWLLDEAL
jgi:hypothetical protein